VILSGCHDTVAGRAVSPIYDPATAGGLPVNDVTSGARSGAPAATLKVHGGQEGTIGGLATLSVEDIEAYWRVSFPRTLSGHYEPVTDIRATDGAHPISGIAGLPQAQCFARQNAADLLGEPNPPLSFLRVAWPFKCVARADRYAFTAFSDNETDVKQQIAAQYRILAGK
jgi:hypothetical protein